MKHFVPRKDKAVPGDNDIPIELDPGTWLEFGPFKFEVVPQGLKDGQTNKIVNTIREAADLLHDVPPTRLSNQGDFFYLKVTPPSGITLNLDEYTKLTPRSNWTPPAPAGMTAEGMGR